MKTRDHQERTGLIGGFNPSQGIVSVLILALLVANLWSTWAGGPREAVAASPQAVAAASTGLRRFYLTPYWRYGNTALTACASGYHMASMWESWILPIWNTTPTWATTEVIAVRDHLLVV
jgi:hypothetical protein